MTRSVHYKGLLLMRGSVAHTLHSEGKFKELDAHLRDVEARYRALLG